MKKLLLASILPIALFASSCQTNQVMWGPCTAGNDPWGTDGTYVLACKDGKWVPVMTVQEFVAIKQGKKVTIAPLPTQPTTTTTAAPATTTTAAPTTTSTTVAPTTTTSTTTTTVPTVNPSISGIGPNEGPTSGGQAVTITGTGFTGTTSVTIGGNAATSVVVVNDTEITAVTPAHAAGSTAVAVTNPSGTDTFNGGYTYVAMPTITGISPNTGSTAGGTTVVITGTNLSGVGSVDFGPTPAASITVDSNTQITVVSPASSAGTVNIRVTSWGGTSDVSSADEFTFS